MKQLIMILIVAVSSTQALAWKETAPTQKEYTFKFELDHTKFEVKKSAPSYEDAFASAAQQCFSHFKGQGKVSEDRGLDIIDVCANPRS
jgi:hypothetical protein